MRRGVTPPDWSKPKKNPENEPRSLLEEEAVPFWERGKSSATIQATPGPSDVPRRPPVPPSHPPNPQSPAPSHPLAQQPSPSLLPLKKRQPVLEKQHEYDDNATLVSNETASTASMSTSTRGSSAADMPDATGFILPPPVHPSAFQKRLASQGTAAYSQPSPTPDSIPPPHPRMPAPSIMPPYNPPQPAAAAAAAAAMPTPTTPGFAPKSALHALYGRPPRRKIISQDHYFTWHNNGPPHELKWTSVFVCPITGEFFWSGRFGDARYYNVTIRDDGSIVVWYTKKTLAEHGAAARCYDCTLWRDEQVRHSMQPLVYLGLDPPYNMDRAMGMPESAPREVRDAMVALQRQIQMPMAGERMQLG